MDENRKKLFKQLRSSYRKYKTHIYYDNYSAIQRLNISRFELKNFYDDKEPYEKKFEEYFIHFTELICSDNFEKYINNLINEMDILSFPKSLKEEKNDFISNYKKPSTDVSKIHYFIDLPVECHILGVLWILRIGYLIDDELDAHCYGNRLNETLLRRLKSNEFNDFSPFLFNPYYKNYQSWRDNGLNGVNKLLDENQNVIMLSLDFKDYYYRSLINFNVLFEDIYRLKNKSKSDSNIFDDDIDEKLNMFIEKVFKAFSSRFNRLMLSEDNTEKFKIEDQEYENNFMIPLGFLPSLIIANWNLNGFDKSILEKLHPFYYGRYVDDVLIVFGFHENSHINTNLTFEELDSEEFLKKYFTHASENPSNGILKSYSFSDKKEGCEEEIKNEIIFKVFDAYVPYNTDLTYNYKNLEIQKNKLKIYKFYHNCPDSIIKNFKTEIFKNSSEFRMMHDSSSILADIEKNIYKIDYDDSINKLNDIKEVRISKYEISKLLSRLNLLSKHIDGNLDEETINKVLNAFNGYILNYMILWEKIFYLLLINDKLKELMLFINKIINLIEGITFSEGNMDFFIKNESSRQIDNGAEILNLKKSLINFLYSSIVRALSLKSVHFNEFEDIFNNLNEKFSELDDNNLFETFYQDISSYIFSLMYNNNLMKYPLHNNNKIFEKLILSDKNISYNFIQCKNQSSDYFNGLYPRFIKLNEFIFHEINNQLFKEGEDETFLDEKITISIKNYNEKNFGENNYSSLLFKDLEFECKCHCGEDICPANFNEYDIDFLKLGKDSEKIKIGLLNTELDDKYIVERLKNNPFLKQERLDNIKCLINEAINKKVKLLIMPEMYIPFEWVEELVKVSKDHQIAMIFGVEPIVNKEFVGNYIMASLPFMINNKYHESALVYRLKNHYSPNELKLYKKYHKKPIYPSKSKYNLFIWNNIFISPYYCFEITNINDRSIFKSCCDIITVSEYNKDTKYFNNIAESLSRDLFCYCVKSNTSQYGGTVILQPSSSERKYLVNLKGGNDDYIVTYDLDIKKLRDDAIKNDEFNEDNYFKPKPPGFNKEVVKKRIGIEKV